MGEGCKPVDRAHFRFSYTLTNVGQIALTDGYEKVAEGAFCEVWVSTKTLKVLGSAPAKDRARVRSIFDHLSESGPDDLNDQQFKSEGRFPTGGRKSKNVMVYVAKAFQLRVYGCWSDGPPRQLKCPEATIKKTNRADQKLLKRVAQSLGD